MNKKLAIKLKAKADEVAKNFSNPLRDNNLKNETFEVDNILPLSDTTAIVIFKKSSGKKSLIFCFHVNYKEGYWGYFFPTDSHISGMSQVGKHLQEIEKHNFEYNFEGEK